MFLVYETNLKILSLSPFVNPLRFKDAKLLFKYIGQIYRLR